jgi:adenosylcobinamide-phosphate synthase
MDGLQISFQSLSVAPDPLLLLLAAMVLDLVTPGRGRQWGNLDPTQWLIAATGFLESRLNRADRSVAKRLFRGTIVVVILVGGAWSAGWGIGVLARVAPFGWVVMVAVMAGLIVQRRPVDEARRVGTALIHDGLGPARTQAVAVLGPRATKLDAAALVRNSVAYVGERLGDGLVGAVFWFVLLGLPGLFAYRAIRIAGTLMPEHDRRFEAFGMVATRLSGVVVLLPALLAGVLVAAASIFSPGADPGRALRVMGADRGMHTPPTLGWSVAALVGALGLAVGAMGSGGRRDAGPADISRAVYVYGITGLLTFGLVAALALARFMA